MLSFSKDVLSIQYKEAIGHAIKQQRIEPVALAEPEGLGDIIFSNQVNLPLSPIEWYSLIKNADTYIGTRMHPIIVCLHNAVPFFSFDGNGTVDAVTGHFDKKSSKVYDILEMAGFEDFTYALNSDYDLPDENIIMNNLYSFSREKCKLFSNRQSKLFNLALERALN